MVENFLEAVAGNELLQAISLVAAAITVIYYALKIILRTGHFLWRRISPTLNKIATDQGLRVIRSINLASTDVIFLVTVVVRRACVTFMFYALYAVSLYDSSNQGSQSPWQEATRIAQFVFSAAGGWNLANLYVWVKRVAKIRQELGS